MIYCQLKKESMRKNSLFALFDLNNTSGIDAKI